ncbi:hypothetical protein [Neolewinella persica]|uniref:hypothetical protein n=1 Tax=Neolewinella persica TaxID=70998 RepID=UPI00036D780F|nr:hypothetical protein [Neolewinella persica]
MNHEDRLLVYCLADIEAKTGWGPSATWANNDFTELSDRIADATGVHLSPTTLKRVWGRVAYASKPSPTTLDALAVFAGYENWRAFRQEWAETPDNKPEINDGEKDNALPADIRQGKSGKADALRTNEDQGLKPAHYGDAKPSTDQPDNEDQGLKPLAKQDVPPGLHRRRARNPLRLYVYYLVPLAVLAAAIALLFPTSTAPAAAPKTGPAGTAVPKLDPADFSFNFRPVTTGVPNSVVFTYDATAAPAGDSVYLQQNWDAERRVLIPRDQHVYTSIYYLPGYFRAKLLVGDQVIKERDLFIRSEGWIAAADRKPVPVYLPLKEVHQEGRLAVSELLLKSLEVPLQPIPPKVVFTHVGALDGLFSDNFAFRTRLRHDYNAGTSTCQQIRVLLLLKNGAISIPLSRPGCTAELSLYAGGKGIDGRTNDLSAFGVVSEDQWLELECTGDGDLLNFSINGQQVFTVESKEDPKEFVGIRYEFFGTGSVDELEFGNSGGVVWWEAF